MKIDVKHLWKTKKKWIIGMTAGVTAAAIGCTIWYQAGHSSKEPVYVFPFHYVGMTEYWGDSQESYGPVTTDKIQTVFLSQTQTVTEVLVQAGDVVKKGDLLMTFDTTLSDLQLERKRLEVEKLKLQYADARDDMQILNCLKPMEKPEDSEDGGSSGEKIKGNELFPRMQDPVFAAEGEEYDGSNAKKALIYWIKDGTNISNDLLANAAAHASAIQELNKSQNSEEDTDDESSDGEVPDGEQTEENRGEDKVRSSASSAAEPSDVSVYVVFKVTTDDTTLGERKVWQCFKITGSDGGYTFRFADTLIPDYSAKAYLEDEEEDAEDNYGSGYTAAEIAQMRADKMKEIKDLDFKIKMTDAEYRIMQKEISDGNIHALSDGKVISVLEEDEAKLTGQPVLKVSGGGGFYVEGSVSELDKAQMQLGQEVAVNDWNTGMTYTGTVESIGDFPSQNGSYGGSGNPNASYYPFMVFVDESADLQAGSYVSIQYSGAQSQHGIYLENPFLRTEKGRSYVLGQQGTLEQRFVTTGKSLWGSYTEILSGLTADDLIAFPYGKYVKPGIAAVEGDLSNLYG